MDRNTCREKEVYMISEAPVDYLYYEKKSASKYNRRCIDGRITSCSNCVGYCTYSRHNGFLTKEHYTEHNCNGKGCSCFLPKIKAEEPQRCIHAPSSEIVKLASEATSGLEGIRIMDAVKRSSGGWFVKYVCITNEYSIKAISNAISALVGEEITMIQLNYSFDRAAHLILQN